MKTMLAAAAAGLALAAAAQAQDSRPVREALTGQQLSNALQTAGLAPTLIKDQATGNPVATGTLPGGLVFVARAMECGGLPKKCGQVVLFANFDVGRELGDADFRIVNAFNEGNLNGRAYVLEDKSQIGVDYMIDLTGGVTDEHVGSKLTRWPAVVGDFQQEMIAAQTGS